MRIIWQRFGINIVGEKYNISFGIYNLAPYIVFNLPCSDSRYLRWYKFVYFRKTK